jgi:hypothetical protein
MNATHSKFASHGVSPRLLPGELARLNPAISEISNYNSPIWDWRTFGGGYGAKRVINFSIEMDDGIYLSDIRFAAVNRALRQLLFAVWSGWTPEKELLKPSTVVHIFQRLLVFVRFICIERRRSSLTEITNGDLDAFLGFMKERSLRYASKERVIEIVCWLWRNQKFIEIGHRPHCPCIWQEMPSHRLLGKRPHSDENEQTHKIPDEVLIPLWTLSMDYLENRAPFLLELLKKRSRLQKDRPGNAAFVLWLNTVRSNDPKYRDSSYCKSIAAIDEGKNEQVFRDLAHFWKEIDHLRGAAIFVLGLVFGARLSTLVTLKPGCIKTVTGHNGQPVVWIRGRLFKTPLEQRGLECDWVVGRFGKFAVEILEQLGAQTRPNPSYIRLIVASRVDKRGDRYGTGAERQIGKTVNSLITSNNICEKNGKLWHFHTHQLRRTFVCLVSRFADFPIATLQGHLGHTANNVTRYYIGKDPGLWLEIAEENESLAKRRLGDMLAEPMAGGGGEILYEAISKGIEQGKLPQDFRGYAGEHIRLELVEELLNSDATWHFQNLNMCRFRQEMALCNPGGTVPMADRCNPLLCENSYISKSIHGPLWVAIERVYSRNLEKHKRSKILAPSLRIKRNEAAEVIKRFGLAGKQGDA